MAEQPEVEAHACSWTQEYAQLSVEHHRTLRQRHASDARNRRMAANCYYSEPRTKGPPTCAADRSRVCKTQCGDPGALIEKGELVR
jgi:hypothetical protein